MIKKPVVQIEDIIYIGKKGNVKGIVCNIYKNTYEGGPELEIVYHQNNAKFIREDIKWVNSYWDFAHEGPNGSYADNDPSLNNFINKLKS